MAVISAAKMSWEQARAVLGVSIDATEADVRAAYLDKVRLHPPDRDPEQFEKIRDANELLRDPRLKGAPGTARPRSGCAADEPSGRGRPASAICRP